MPKGPQGQNAPAQDRLWFRFRAMQFGGALLILALVSLISKAFPGVNREAIALGFALIFALFYAFRIRKRGDA